jgi:hypothetical protein
MPNLIVKTNTESAVCGIAEVWRCRWDYSRTCLKDKKMKHFWQHLLAGQPQNTAELVSINQVERDWNLLRCCALSNVSNRRLECSVFNFTVKHSKWRPVRLDWLALKLVEIRSSKTLVTIYFSTWRNIPQDLNLRHFSYEKFKSGITIFKPSYSLCIQVQINCTCSICNGHD